MENGKHVIFPVYALNVICWVAQHAFGAPQLAPRTDRRWGPVCPKGKYFPIMTGGQIPYV